VIPHWSVREAKRFTCRATHLPAEIERFPIF
jgi:hypothetical protein